MNFSPYAPGSLEFALKNEKWLEPLDDCVVERSSLHPKRIRTYNAFVTSNAFLAQVSMIVSEKNSEVTRKCEIFLCQS